MTGQACQGRPGIGFVMLVYVTSNLPALLRPKRDELFSWHLGHRALPRLGAAALALFALLERTESGISQIQKEANAPR